MAEKKILMVVAPQGFHDEQYQICRQLWERRRYAVSVTSLGKAARGQKGIAVPVDVIIKDVKSIDYEAVVFIGGEGTKILFDDEATRKMIEEVKHKVLGASDRAVVLLSLAGVLEGKKVTGPPESVSWLVKGKAQYTGDPIRVEERLITIQDPAMSEEMAKAILKVLEE
ncbi:MAG: DJ-1/PfpI family protein [Chloroflexi bacterium]|nr:DJ-1/PfpI family protein [Chloroflexota bacterium]